MADIQQGNTKRGGGEGPGELKPAISIQNSPPPKIFQQETQQIQQRLWTIWSLVCGKSVLKSNW